MKIYDKVLGKYQVQKTLKFELKPVGNTLQQIDEDKVLELAKKQQDDYEEIKTIISDYQIEAINNCLTSVTKSSQFNKLLQDYINEVNNTNKNYRNIEELKKQLRTFISKTFQKDYQISSLTREDFICDLLPNWDKLSDNQKTLLESYKNYPNFFDKYIENCQEYYTNKQKSSSISHRLVDENLNTFSKNLSSLQLAEKNIKLPNHIKSNLNLMKNHLTAFTQDSIDNYNKLVNGYTKENGEIVPGINFFISKYNQLNYNRKLPTIEPLNKVLMSKAQTFSFIPDKFETDEEVEKSIITYVEQIKSSLTQDEDYGNLEDIIKSIGNYNASKIAVKNDNNAIELSNKILGDWKILPNLFKSYAELEAKNKPPRKDGKLNKPKEKDYYTFKMLYLLLQGNKSTKDIDLTFNYKEELMSCYLEYMEMINNYDPNIPFNQNISYIRELLEKGLDLRQLLKIVYSGRGYSLADVNFYRSLHNCYENLGTTVSLYNKITSYVNKKSYSIEKMKMNFNCKKFLSSWNLKDMSKSRGILLVSEDKYYLAVIKDNFTGYITGKPNNKDDFKVLNYIDKKVNIEKFNIRTKKKQVVEEIRNFIKWAYISKQEIKENLENHKMYLFEIYTRDFSPYAKGTPNLNTLYWKAFFSEENQNKGLIKLNGESKVFFREKSIPNNEIIYHPANTPIKNKVDGGTALFNYDIIKNKRYTMDKFLFYTSVVFNPASPEEGKVSNIINYKIKDSDDMHIIGIDRGEKNLLYISVIDLNGNIIEQRSLNEIQNINEKQNTIQIINYRNKLRDKENYNQKQKQNWSEVQGLKDFKKGYLSRIIYEITQLIIKYNAILVLEDLNENFMEERQKVDANVYRDFENALLRKLNYMCIKSKETNEDGSACHGYQLTELFSGKRKLPKQSGIVFFVDAWNTSKTDPTTGFINMFKLPNDNNIQKIRSFFGKFKSIRFNPMTNSYEFKFDYKSFSKELTVKLANIKSDWILSSNVKRIEHVGNSVNKYDNLTIEFEKILSEYDINKELELVPILTQTSNDDFILKFFKLFKLLLQIRNSNSKTGEDFISSPALNNDNKLFLSSEDNPNLPVDSDANGAYNIAKKGLYIVQQIKATDLKLESRLLKDRISISEIEWIDYATRNTLKNN